MSTGAEPSQDASRAEPTPGTQPSSGAVLASELAGIQTPITPADAYALGYAMQARMEGQGVDAVQSGMTEHTPDASDPLVAEALARQAEAKAAAEAWEAEQATAPADTEQVAESAPETEQEGNGENPLEVYRQQMNDYFGQAQTREELDEFFEQYIGEQPLAQLEASGNGLGQVAHALDNHNEAGIILADAYNDRAEALLSLNLTELTGPEAPRDPEAERDETQAFFAEAQDPAQLDRYLKQLIAEGPVEGRPIVTLIKTSSGESFAQAGVFTDKSMEARSAMIAQLFNERMGELVRAQTAKPPEEQAVEVAQAATGTEAPKPVAKTTERLVVKVPESLDKPELGRKVTEDFKALVGAKLAEARSPQELIALLESLQTQKHYDREQKRTVVDQPGYLRFDADKGEFTAETVAGRRGKGETGRAPRVPAERSVYILEQAQARLEELSGSPTAPDVPTPAPDAAPSPVDAAPTPAPDSAPKPATPDATPVVRPSAEPLPTPTGPRVEAPAPGPKPGEALRPPTEADVEAARNTRLRVMEEMRGARPDLVEDVSAKQFAALTALENLSRISAEEAGSDLGNARVSAALESSVAASEALRGAEAALYQQAQERTNNSRLLYAAKADEMQALLKAPVSKKALPVVAFRAIDGDPAMSSRIIRELQAKFLPGTDFSELMTENDVKVGDRSGFIEKTFISPNGIMRIDRWDATTGQLVGVTYGRLTAGTRAARETLPRSVARYFTTLKSQSVPQHEKLKRLGGARKLANRMRDALDSPANEPGRRALNRPDSARRLQRDVARGFARTASDLAAAAMAELGYTPDNMFNMKFSKKLTNNSAWYTALTRELHEQVVRPQSRAERAAKATKKGVKTGAKTMARVVKAAPRVAAKEAVAASKLATEFTKAAVEAGKQVANEQIDKRAAKRRAAEARPLPPPIAGTARRVPEAELPPPTV